eukprot:c29138_g1_i2 orf=154-1197(+)
MAILPADQPPRTLVDQIPGFLSLYDDGSVERTGSLTTFIPACQRFVNGVATKDVLVDSQTQVMARIFLPEVVASDSDKTSKKLPIVLHFHGGGFCVGSAFSDPFHSFCSRMAVKSQSIWVSVEYRLAPEHRLPAAYEDSLAALTWLRSQACKLGNETAIEEWISDMGDFSTCFVVGESAGGTIVHYMATLAAGKDWNPVKIRGLMIIHAGLFNDIPVAKPTTEKLLTEDQIAAFLRLSSPLGAQQRHPLANPSHVDAPNFSQMDLPAMLLAVAENDLLCDKGLEYCEALKKAGKDVDLFVSEGKGHCFHLSDPLCEEADVLERRLIVFMERFYIPGEVETLGSAKAS